MASEFRKPRCIKIPAQPLLTVDPLSNLLLPLFSCSAFWRPFPVQLQGSAFQLSGAHVLFSHQGSASFRLSGAHFLFSLHGSASFQLFLAPASCSASWLHILFNPLPAYSIEIVLELGFGS